jgi:nucleotide-binding universal stress UspA family protein
MLLYQYEMKGVMMAFTHILVPTDFSEPARQALRCALEEAALHHARVTLLHVRPPHTGTEVYVIAGVPRTEVGFDPALEGRLGASLPPQPTVIRQDHDEEALTRLRDLMLDGFQGTWEAEVATGPPAEAIVRVAHVRGADLIVMGTHGRTGLPHVLLGSVAEKVVRLAPCPVLTVKEMQTEGKAGR